MLAVVLGAVYLRSQGPSAGALLPGCPIHQLTGLSCPGCGMTRAAHAVLHGRFADAFSLNPLGALAMPVFLGMIAFCLPGWLCGGRAHPFPRLGPRFWWGALGVVVAYGILRNIPLWPFTWLAPA